MRLRILPLLVLSASLLACGGRTSHDRASNAPVAAPIAGQPVTVTLESPGAGSLPAALFGGSIYYAGQDGQQYAIRIANNTAARVEVVVTVDGRDVMSGKLGDFKRQRGYVIDPFGEVVIDGFRRSLDHVAAFRFSSVRDSYTGRRGTPQHAGVIGVAVFRERAVRRAWKVDAFGDGLGAHDEASATRSKSPPATKPALGATEQRRAGAEKLGTEFGETLVSQVVEVPFVRSNGTKPDELHKITYDSAERLRARGVPIEPVFVAEPWDRGEPQPWPGASPEREFTPPPPRRWR